MMTEDEELSMILLGMLMDKYRYDLKLDSVLDLSKKLKTICNLYHIEISEDEIQRSIAAATLCILNYKIDKLKN